MSKPDDGGLAFPALAHHSTGGMTLRDHFAGLAIAGFSKGMVDYGWDDEVLNGHTKMAYWIADSMLAARSARTTTLR